MAPDGTAVGGEGAVQALVVATPGSGRDLIAQALVERGHTVAATGPDVTDRDAAGPAELVVVEHAPGRLDGLARCRGLCAGRHGAVPWILVVVDRDAAGGVEAALAAGASDCLLAPIDPGALALRLACAEQAVAMAGASRSRSEARFRSLVDHALDVVAVVDAEGTIQSVSPAITRILGFDPDDLVGVPSFDLVHPDDREELRRLFAEVLTDSQDHRPSDFRARHKDGRWCWLEAVGTNLLADPHVGGVVINARDIDGRKAAEEALRRSEARFRGAAEGSFDAFFVLESARGGDGRIEDFVFVDLNRRGAEMVDRRREELIGQRLCQIFPINRTDGSFDCYARVVETGQSLEDEFALERPDGTTRWFHHQVVRVEDGVALTTRDVTERRLAELSLHESERRHRLLLASAERQAREAALLDRVRSALAQKLELPVLFRTVVEATAETFGYTLVSLYLIEGDDLVLQHQVGYDRVIERFPITAGVAGRVVRGGEPVLLEDGPADPDFLAAMPGVVSEVCVPLRDEGRVVGVLILESTDGVALGPRDLRLMRALSDHVAVAIGRARLYSEVRASEARFAAFMGTSPVMAWMKDERSRFVYANQTMAACFGRTPAELLGVDDFALLPAAVAERVRADDARVLAAGRPIETQESIPLPCGKVREWLTFKFPFADLGGRPRVGGVAIDITDRIRAEAQLAHLAFHDPLTGLPNRALFHDRLAAALDRAGAPAVAVLLLDLDGFKLVNDSRGHDAGDELLIAVGRRIAQELRTTDTVARLGGDEFAVLIEEAPPAAEVEAIARRLIGALGAPFLVGDRETFINASIGIALAGPERRDPTHLLQDADTALYRAKARGRASHAVFEPEMRARVIARLERETSLRGAAERGELCLYFQPQIDLAHGRLVGLEALVRWNHPEHGLLAPADFIRMAEETDLIVPVGRWTLREACRQARRWRDASPAAPLLVGVNLSPRQLAQPGLVAEVAAVLAETELPPEALELEITENAVVEPRLDAVGTIRRLRRLGVRLAIDDFGTGYSALSYLRELAVDGLKVDRSFVAALGVDPGSLPIVRAITSLGRDLRLTVTAEGVETAAQLRLLRDLAVDVGQGYLFSRPVPAEAVPDLLGGPAWLGPHLTPGRDGDSASRPIADRGTGNGYVGRLGNEYQLVRDSTSIPN